MNTHTMQYDFNAVAQLRLPTTLYQIVTDYGQRFGIDGVALDDREEVCDFYGAKLSDFCPSRVFKIELDASTNLPETIRDITDEIHAEMVAHYAANGWTMPEI